VNTVDTVREKEKTWREKEHGERERKHGEKTNSEGEVVAAVAGGGEGSTRQRQGRGEEDRSPIQIFLFIK